MLRRANIKITTKFSGKVDNNDYNSSDISDIEQRDLDSVKRSWCKWFRRNFPRKRRDNMKLQHNITYYRPFRNHKSYRKS